MLLPVLGPCPAPLGGLLGTLTVRVDILLADRDTHTCISNGHPLNYSTKVTFLREGNMLGVFVELHKGM